MLISFYLLNGRLYSFCFFFLFILNATKKIRKPYTTPFLPSLLSCKRRKKKKKNRVYIKYYTSRILTTEGKTTSIELFMVLGFFCQFIRPKKFARLIYRPRRVYGLYFVLFVYFIFSLSYAKS